MTTQKQLIVSGGISLDDVRAIRSSVRYQDLLQKANQYIPADQEIKDVQLELYRKVISGQLIPNGKGEQVNLATILNDEDGFETLVNLFRGIATQRDVSDLVAKACLRMAAPVIRERKVLELDEYFVSRYMRLKSIAKIGEVAA